MHIILLLRVFSSTSFNIFQSGSKTVDTADCACLHGTLFYWCYCIFCNQLPNLERWWMDSVHGTLCILDYLSFLHNLGRHSDICVFIQQFEALQCSFRHDCSHFCVNWGTEITLKARCMTSGGSTWRDVVLFVKAGRRLAGIRRGVTSVVCLVEQTRESSAGVCVSPGESPQRVEPMWSGAKAAVDVDIT